MSNFGVNFAGGAGGALSGASLAITGAITSATLATTGAITGASVAATGDVSGATVTAPIFRTATAADVVFQRNSVEVARITSTGWALALGKRWELYNVGVPGDANYERAAIKWTSNAMIVGPEAGGTGVNRAAHYLSGDGSGWKISGSGVALLDGTSSGMCSMQAFSDTTGIAIYGKQTSGVTNPSFTVANSPSGSNFTAASGTQILAKLWAHSVNQSGSANFVNTVIDTVPVSTGSGTVYGLSVQRSTVQVFGIDVKATLTNESDTVMWLTYFSGSLKHKRVTLGVDVAGQRALQVATT